jgi:hypothetical protein
MSVWVNNLLVVTATKLGESVRPCSAGKFRTATNFGRIIAQTLADGSAQSAAAGLSDNILWEFQHPQLRQELRVIQVHPSRRV